MRLFALFFVGKHIEQTNLHTCLIPIGKVDGFLKKSKTKWTRDGFTLVKRGVFKAVTVSAAREDHGLHVPPPRYTWDDVVRKHNRGMM